MLLVKKKKKGKVKLSIFLFGCIDKEVGRHRNNASVVCDYRWETEVFSHQASSQTSHTWYIILFSNCSIFYLMGQFVLWYYCKITHSKLYVFKGKKRGGITSCLLGFVLKCRKVLWVFLHIKYIWFSLVMFTGMIWLQKTKWTRAVIFRYVPANAPCCHLWKRRPVRGSSAKRVK